MGHDDGERDNDGEHSDGQHSHGCEGPNEKREANNSGLTHTKPHKRRLPERGFASRQQAQRDPGILVFCAIIKKRDTLEMVHLESQK